MTHNTSSMSKSQTNGIDFNIDSDTWPERYDPSIGISIEQHLKMNPTK